MRLTPRAVAPVCLALLLVVAVAAGCDPPAPPKPANAVIDTEAAWSSRGLDLGDTVVVVRCRGADEYAKTPRGKNWEDHWYLVTCDVLKVERGTWADKDVKFVYLDSWPTPESGIRVDKAPFPFPPGCIFALALKTKDLPAHLVAMERRSFVAPYGPLATYKWSNTPEGKAEYARIEGTAAAYEAREKIAAEKAITDTVEDAADAWIVHRRNGWSTDSGSWLYRVDKKTFEVSPVP